jgi:hypothetical protein
MIIKKELLKREIAGESFLVPLGKTVYDSNGLFILTELGAFLWDLLPEAESEDDLVHAVLNEYDVEEDIARTDIREFLEKLKTLQIL